jgi:hypothetical protein
VLDETPEPLRDMALELAELRGRSGRAARLLLQQPQSECRRSARPEGANYMSDVMASFAGCRHCRHRVVFNVAIWSRRIISLIRVNQASRCRVFLSGKGTGALNRDKMGLLYLMSFRVRPGLPLTGQHYRSGRPFPP